MDRRREQLRAQNERPVRRDQDKIEIRQLREQLRQQEQSHRHYYEDTQKFLQDCHVKTSSIVRSLGFLQPVAFTKCARGVPEPRG